MIATPPSFYFRTPEMFLHLSDKLITFAAVRVIFVILGSVCVALGILGIFLPLLPTTPFMLLAAALYCRGSDKLYNWLITHKYLGTYIRNFREYKAIPVRVKVTATSLMGLMMSYCIFFVVNPLWLKILLGCIMLGVGYHILSYKTMTKEMAAELREKERQRKECEKSTEDSPKRQ